MPTPITPTTLKPLSRQRDELKSIKETPQQYQMLEANSKEHGEESQQPLGLETQGPSPQQVASSPPPQPILSSTPAMQAHIVPPPLPSTTSAARTVTHFEQSSFPQTLRVDHDPSKTASSWPAASAGPSSMSNDIEENKQEGDLLLIGPANYALPELTPMQEAATIIVRHRRSSQISSSFPTYDDAHLSYSHAPQSSLPEVSPKRRSSILVAGYRQRKSSSKDYDYLAHDESLTQKEFNNTSNPSQAFSPAQAEDTSAVLSNPRHRLSGSTNMGQLSEKLEQAETKLDAVGNAAVVHKRARKAMPRKEPGRPLGPISKHVGQQSVRAQYLGYVGQNDENGKEDVESGRVIKAEHRARRISAANFLSQYCTVSSERLSFYK